MKINKWYIQGDITVSPTEIIFEGTSSDFQGEKSLKLKLLLSVEVKFSFRQKTHKGIIKKINKTTALLESSTLNRTLKVSIENIVENNRYQSTYYRIQHKVSKQGPFQHKFTSIKPDIQNAISERVQTLKENYYSYPTPEMDDNLKDIWFNSSNKKDFFFACLSESDISLWLGNELEELLLNDEFEIVKVQERWDFQHSFIGTNQVMLLK